MIKNPLYQKRLEEEKTMILGRLREIGADVRNNNHEHWEPKVSDVDTLRSDASDVADRLETYGENTATILRLNIRLEELNAAFKKLETSDQEFGTCAVCGMKIEEDRMEANPAATTCKKHIRAKI